MTDMRMALAELLREMVGFVAQRMMDLDVEGLCGAEHGERSAARSNWRNGYRDRNWETRSGTIPLKIPKLLSSDTNSCGADSISRCNTV